MAALLLYSHPLMELELARQQWQDGNRRVESARSDARRYRRLVGGVELVSPSFTISAKRWMRLLELHS